MTEDQKSFVAYLVLHRKRRNRADIGKGRVDYPSSSSLPNICIVLLSSKGLHLQGGSGDGYGKSRNCNQRDLPRGAEADAHSDAQGAYRLKLLSYSLSGS